MSQSETPGKTDKMSKCDRFPQSRRNWLLLAKRIQHMSAIKIGSHTAANGIKNKLNTIQLLAIISQNMHYYTFSFSANRYTMNRMGCHLLFITLNLKLGDSFAQGH